MRYQFNVTLTEEDYLTFNYFHSLESAAGKKAIKKSRIFFVAAMAILMVFFILITGWRTFSIAYVTLLGLFTVVYVLLFKKILKRNIKTQIRKLKKSGKLPYDAEAVLEFYDDRLVEITADKRIEQRYDGLERICVAKEPYLYLYHSSVNAYILPVRQLKAQVNQEEFMSFLLTKCSCVEYY